jgi:hypothetical protein
MLVYKLPLIAENKPPHKGGRMNMDKYAINRYANMVEIRLPNRKIEIYRGEDNEGDVFVFRAMNCLSKEALEKCPEDIRKTFARGRVKFTEISFTEEALAAIVKSYLAGIPYYDKDNQHNTKELK